MTLNFNKKYICRRANISFDAYWAAALIGSYRAVVSIIGPSITRKCRRRVLYLSCCGVQIIGLLSLAAYGYFDHNESLSETHPMTRWIPIISILIVFSAYAFGFGSIPYMLQVQCLKAIILSKKVILI